ncbi:replication protein B [Mute swan feces associated circular virus 13]|nr:replication protein B [Mute swan feces associated circular virus 13]
MSNRVKSNRVKFDTTGPACHEPRELEQYYPAHFWHRHTKTKSWLFHVILLNSGFSQSTIGLPLNMKTSPPQPLLSGNISSSAKKLEKKELLTSNASVSSTPSAGSDKSNNSQASPVHILKWPKVRPSKPRTIAKRTKTSKSLENSQHLKANVTSSNVFESGCWLKKNDLQMQNSSLNSPPSTDVTDKTSYTLWTSSSHAPDWSPKVLNYDSGSELSTSESDQTDSSITTTDECS